MINPWLSQELNSASCHSQLNKHLCNQHRCHLNVDTFIQSHTHKLSLVAREGLEPPPFIGILFGCLVSYQLNKPIALILPTYLPTFTFYFGISFATSIPFICSCGSKQTQRLLRLPISPSSHLWVFPHLSVFLFSQLHQRSVICVH